MPQFATYASQCFQKAARLDRHEPDERLDFDRLKVAAVGDRNRNLRQANAKWGVIVWSEASIRARCEAGALWSTPASRGNLSLNHRIARRQVRAAAQHSV